MQWHGIDVLTVEPNRAGAVDEACPQKLYFLDNETGDPWLDPLGDAPAPVRSFLWTCFGLPAIAELRTFIDARRGRVVPFWLPSWQQDLRLASDVHALQDTISVVRVGYGSLMYPGTGARRHIAFLKPGQTLVPFKVRAASDPGSGDLEYMTVLPRPDRIWEAARTVICFLKLCRLEADRVRIEWFHPRLAQAGIRFREIPNEAPL